MGQLVDFSIQAPGFYGLNKQNSGDILPSGWATEAINFVFDDVGRLASRNGTQYVNATAISATPNVQTIHEYIDVAGNSTIILAAGNKIYYVNGSTLTDITGSISITADHWQFVNFNGNVVGIQDNHNPIIYKGSGTFTYLVDEHTTWAASTAYVVGDLVVPTTTSDYYLYCSTAGTSSGTEPIWNTTEGSTTTDGTATWTAHKIPVGSASIAAGGRLWILEGTTLRYSDILIPYIFDTTNVANQFDLKTVWRNGMDVGQALAEFNGHLCIFGRKTITVYQGYDDVTTMSLVENLGGIGIIGRDTLQDIGTDILYLSNTGVRSLGRTIQEKSMPIHDISKNIRQYLINKIFSETASEIKSNYDPKRGMYLLTLPTDGTVFVFDVRQPMQDGTFKVTEWDVVYSSIHSAIDGTMYIGSAGYIAKYLGYTDNKLYDATGGSTYDVSFESAWTDFGEEAASRLKLPKRASLTLYGGSGQEFLFKWAFDYSGTFNSANITIAAGTPSEYGIAEYNIAEYSGGLDFNNLKRNLSKTGRIMKVGMSSTVSGRTIALQRLSVQSQLGRMVI